MGKTPPRSESIYWGKDFKWVSIADMVESGIIYDTKEYISLKGFNDKFSGTISPKGTLIMSFKLTVGKVSILGDDCLHNEAIISIFPFFDYENITRNYLFEILPLISQNGNTKSAIKGKTLNSTSINNLLVPLAPLREQLRIVNKLEATLPHIKEYNEKYQKLEKLNNNYKEKLKKSILQYAIQGKLVKQNLADESAEVLINKILDEKRELIRTKQIKKEKLSVIYKDSTDNQFYEKFDDGKIVNITDEIPFDIPQNWSWTRLKNIGNIVGGGTPKTDNPKNWENANIPWLTPADMKFIKGKYASKGIRNISQMGLENSSAQLMPKNTILYSSRAPIGYIAIAENEICTNQGFKSLVLINEEMVNYLYYLLIERTSFIISKASGTTFKEISGTEMGNILVPIPPLEEQNRIVMKIEILFKTI